MSLTFTDPAGAVGSKAIAVSFPAFDQAEVEIDRADGSSRTISFRGPPVEVTVALDDTVRLHGYHFTGERACGCGAGGAGAPVGAIALLLAMAARKVRRNERRTAPASQRGRGL